MAATRPCTETAKAWPTSEGRTAMLTAPSELTPVETFLLTGAVTVTVSPSAAESADDSSVTAMEKGASVAGLKLKRD